MPTSPPKRQSGGGRLRRLLASLRPPAPLPVQTGFPTSLADIVVKNHGRLRIPRRRRRATGATVPPPAAAAEPPAQSQQRSELSVADDAAAPAPAPAPPRPGKGAAGSFSIRPGLLLAAGGAVALALLVIWSKQLVAAATLASLALSWIESASARTGRARRPDIREAAVPPRPRSRGESESDNADDDISELCCGGDTSSPVVDNTKPKQSRRRSLRKLLASKLRNNGKTARGKDDSRRGGEREHEHERPETARKLNAEAAAAAAAAGPAEKATSLPEAITDADELCQGHRRRGGAFSLPALVPIVLAGLVAGGKLPALALAVLCGVFFSSSVDGVPAPDSGDAIPR